MNFRDFETKYGKSILITNKMLELQEKNMPYVYRLLSEWKKKEWILQLKKGMYIINHEYYTKQLNTFFLANQLYFPSYVSLETTLSFYNLIPEGVYCTTSVSTNKTNSFQNKFSSFTYASIKKTLFFGYEVFQENQQKYFFASKEKAMLDFLYFNLKNLTIETNLVEMYRFQNVKQLNITVLKKYLVLFENKKLSAVVKKLLKDSSEENYQNL
jgi:predicted transcriptional regulator of viral defense system